MKLTVPQFGAIQANFALRVSGPEKDLSSTKKSLEQIGGSLGKIALLDQVGTRWSTGRQASAILFRFEKEDIFSANMILHEHPHPAPKLHIERSSQEILPTLIGLHYFHNQRDSVEKALYLWSGIVQATSDPDFEYTAVEDDSPFLQLAGAFYTLNLPVAHLPYPEGRKLALLNLLKEIGITYIGDLIQKDANELEKKLGKSALMEIRGILKAWVLPLGTHLPYWRPPR